MGIADELQKLSDLLTQGVLTKEEFTQAKARLLANPTGAPTVEVGSFFEEQLAEVRHQNELARIDREWEIERRRYQIVGRNGRTFTPTIGTGLATAFVGGFFGLFWTAVAYVATEVSRISLFPDHSFSIIGSICVTIGLLFTIGAIWRGLYLCLLAQNYNVAYRAYKARHLKESSLERPASHTTSR